MDPLNFISISTVTGRETSYKNLAFKSQRGIPGSFMKFIFVVISERTSVFRNMTYFTDAG
jgi:hypothetical protein